MDRYLGDLSGTSYGHLIMPCAHDDSGRPMIRWIQSAWCDWSAYPHNRPTYAAGGYHLVYRLQGIKGETE